MRFRLECRVSLQGLEFSQKKRHNHVEAERLYETGFNSLGAKQIMKLISYVRDVENFLKRCRLSLENFVQRFFRTLSRRAHLKMAHQKIRDETTEHIDHLSSALKKIVLPLSVCYLCLGFFFGNNVVDSLFLGILIFVYSHFLPICYRLSELKTETREIKTPNGLKNMLYCSLPHYSSSCYGETGYLL